MDNLILSTVMAITVPLFVYLIFSNMHRSRLVASKEQLIKAISKKLEEAEAPKPFSAERLSNGLVVK